MRTKITLACLIIFLSLVNYASAGDSATFTVSCTIPSIPGVNAPSFEETTVRSSAERQPAAEKQETIQAEENEEAPAMIQEDSEETMLAEGTSSEIIVKTIYSR